MKWETRCLHLTNEDAKAQRGEWLPSWRGRLLPGRPGTLRSRPGAGVPSRRGSRPWAFAHAVPGTEEETLLVPHLPESSQQPCVVDATLQVKKLSLREVWCLPFPPATQGVGGRARTSSPPPSPHPTPTPGTPPRDLPPTRASSGIYGFACKRTSHPDKIETFYGATKI